jgi:hypothetical protein
MGIRATTLFESIIKRIKVATIFNHLLLIDDIRILSCGVFHIYAADGRRVREVGFEPTNP